MAHPWITKQLGKEEFLPCLYIADQTIPVTLRKSPRARNLLVRLVPGQGVVVVVPRSAGAGAAKGLLERKRAWIELTVSRMIEQGADFSGTPPPLPKSITLPAIGLNLPLAAMHREGRAKLMENAGRLTLSGPTDEPERMFLVLKEFVRAKAKTALPPMLRKVSRDTGLSFDEVCIRCQKTRWGSCSTRKGHSHISLNASLLFLPPELCEQILLHELCHTRHSNHSAAYWSLVESINPKARTLEGKLRHGWHFVPTWWDVAKPLNPLTCPPYLP